MRALLQTFSWQELRHHPWRSGAAVAAIMLGVALALAVHLINRSALSEFAQAVSSVNGQPDAQLRGSGGTLAEGVFAQVAARDDVRLATPVLEVQSTAIDTRGQRVALRLVGVDVLSIASLAPALIPTAPAPAPGQNRDEFARFDVFAPDTLYLNASARAALQGDSLQLQSGLGLQNLRVAGSVSAGGAPLAVMDIGALQDFANLQGQLTRIDLRLQPGVAVQDIEDRWQLDSSVVVAAPGADTERASTLSRAYRVNLTVLALVALFTGAFLVFSVLSLSVTKRLPQLALLGVLGLTGRERLRLVLAESALLGVVGSALGLGLGAFMAWGALRLMGGDLGGGYFAGVQPTLQWSSAAALLFGALGVVAALVGGWWPARSAQRLAPAQALKNLGTAAAHPLSRRAGLVALALLLLAALLSLLPPIAGIPLAAYVAVALLLLAGVALVPAVVTQLLAYAPLQRVSKPLWLLALERARRTPSAGAVATSGVVASVALAVALTIMVASFRDSVSRWLDVLLPADVYVRSSASSGVSTSAYLPDAFVRAVAELPGVQRVESLRVQQLPLQASMPPVALLVREFAGPPSQSLPLVGRQFPVPSGTTAVYVSEAFAQLYNTAAGQFLELKLPIARVNTAQAATTSIAFEQPQRYYVAALWRDYARQHGSLVINRSDFLRLGGDARVNDLALSLRTGTNAGDVQAAIRQLAKTTSNNPQADQLLEFASSSDIRAISLRIFDRSFAVTYWLQAVTIGIGLFGVAASFSAQVLSRRKEFGLLAHLGLTRTQILRLVATEGLVWTLLGTLAGLLLGLGVASILVHVVNPQSFHWSMDMALPYLRLGALALAVVLAGTLTAWLAGRAAASREAVVAVKEDW
jgi:putative ABC transport system permease protein